MYRRAVATSRGVVAYGPFPTAWWKLGLAPVLWFLAFVFAGMSDVRLQVDCEREACVMRSTGWRRAPRLTRGARLIDAELSQKTKGKNGDWHARVSLKLQDGARVSLERTDLKEAEAQVQQAKELIAGQRPRFQYDSGDKRWLVLVSAALYLAGLALVADTLWRRRALSMKVEGGQLLLREPGRWWRWLPPRSFPLSEVTDVVVRWHQLRPPAQKAVALWGATLDLVHANQRTEALTTIPRDGLMAHYDAAMALKTLLELPPGAPRDRCPAEALGSMPLQGLGALFPMIWLGLCCGSLGGMALYGLVKITLDPAALDRNVGSEALVFAGLSAVALASLLAGIVLAHRRERQRHDEIFPPR